MAEGDRLVTAAAVQIVTVDPEHDHARLCLNRYAEELNRRSRRTFDPAVGATARPDEVRPPAGQFFIACARDAGARVARIETNSDLTEALALYTSAGWREVAPFNDEPYADRWLEKRLVQ